MDEEKVKELARRHRSEFDRRQQVEAMHVEYEARMHDMVTEPWNELIQGLKRFAFVYNEAHSRQGFYVEHYPQLYDEIRIRTDDGLHVLQLNRETGKVDAAGFDLSLRVVVGEVKLVWVFNGTVDANSGNIAQAIGETLTERAAGGGGSSE